MPEAHRGRFPLSAADTSDGKLSPKKEEKGSATSRLLAWGWTDAHASFSASFSQWQPRSEQHKTGRDKNTSKEPKNNAKCAYLPLLITV